MCVCVAVACVITHASQQTSLRQPECVRGKEAAAELEGFVQRAAHFLAGLVVRAHVLDAGHQLVEPLTQEHLGP